MTIKNVFVVNGPTSNQIGVVRGLGRNFPEMKIHLLGFQKTFVNFSRYAHFNHIVPDWNEFPDAFAEQIFQLFDAAADAIVIPTDDSSALILSRYKKRWVQRNVHILVADHEVVKTIVNKDLFAKKMAALGIPVLDSIRPKNHHEIQDLLNAGTQLFVKPADARADKKYFILKTSDDCTRRNGSNLEIDKCIFQKWIGGYRIYMVYVFMGAGGNIAACGYDKIRQFPPYAGSGTFVITCRREELIERSIEVLKLINYEGFAEFEYKYDQTDDTWYLLDVNPRTTTQSRVSDGAAVDVEVFAVNSIVGNFNKVVQTQFQEGLKWMLEIDDFLCFLYRKRDATITVREWRDSLRNITNFGIWAKDDVTASLVYYLFWFFSKRRWMRLIRRPVSRSAEHR